ncbi:MAG: hypothetical protein GY772_29340 [bacterium]|nr:hypothetical protein [bacterium]
MTKPFIEPYSSSGRALYSSQGMLLPQSYQADVYRGTLGEAPFIEPYSSSGRALYSSQGMLLPQSYQADVYRGTLGTLDLKSLGNSPYADQVLLDGLADTSLFDAEGESYGPQRLELGDFKAPKADKVGTPRLKKELREVIEAALEPGTERNRAVGLKLLAKADQLTDLMEKRAQATDKIRGDMNRQVRVADAMDQKTLRDIHANIRPGVTPTKQAVLKIARDRKEAFGAARKGVRLQKANIVASSLTVNALEQTSLLQRMATAVANGQPQLAAVYGGMYDKMARTSDGLRTIRKEQIAKGQKNAPGLAGLAAYDPHLASLMEADDAEAELAAQEYVEMNFLEGFADVPPGLEGLDSLWSRLKKAAKKVKKGVKKAVKRVRNTTVVKNAIKVAGPVTKAIKNTVKAGAAPLTATYAAARAVSRGKSIKTAFRSAGKSLRRSARALGKAVGNLTLGIACAMEDTRLGRAAAQYAGQAVGTIYGGGPTVGGAVGKELGRTTNEINRTACKGLKASGLTGEKKFRGFRNVGRHMKKVGRELRKNVFSLEAQKARAMRLAGNMLGGGVSPIKIPGTDKLMSFATDKALDAAKSYAKRKGTEIARKVGVKLTRQVLGRKAAQAVDRASNYARMAIQQGGGAAAKAIATDLGPVAGGALLKRAGVNPALANQISGAGNALAQMKAGNTLKWDAKTASALAKKFGPALAQRMAIKAGMSPATSRALMQVAQQAPNLSSGKLNTAMMRQMLTNKARSYGRREINRRLARNGITPRNLAQARSMWNAANNFRGKPSPAQTRRLMASAGYNFRRLAA